MKQQTNPNLHESMKQAGLLNGLNLKREQHQLMMTLRKNKPLNIGFLEKVFAISPYPETHERKQFAVFLGIATVEVLVRKITKVTTSHCR